MMIKEHEPYQMKIYETTLRLYYLSTEGKVGYVLKAALAANGQMDEKLIHWLDPRTIIRNNKPILVITVDYTQHTIKKLMATKFMPTYKDRLHYVNHLNGDYKDCRLLNLTLANKSQTLSKHITRRNKIAIQARHRITGLNRHYDCLEKAADGLAVSIKTLRNYLQRKVYNSVLDEYKFYVKGRVFIPRKKRGVSYTTVLRVIEKT